METMNPLLVVDIGATHFRLGLARGQKLQLLGLFDTPQDWPSAQKVIVTTAIEHKVSGLIVGLPGTLDDQRQQLLRSPNVPEWTGQPIAKVLRKATGLPVLLENDVLLNALGEAKFGAGKHYSIVGFLTVSTGVNGARIIDEQPDPGAFSYELGLLPVHGVSIESIISGRALAEVHGLAPDRLPVTTWQAVERSLSTVALQLSLIWRPEVMIFGGPMVREKNIDLKRVAALVQQRWQHPAEPPAFVSGSLKGLSGLWGGIAYVDLHSEAIFGTVAEHP